MTMELKNYKVYRFCDGEIVDGLNRKHYNPQKEDDMQCICTILNAQIHQLNKLQKEKQQLKNNLLEIEKIINNRLDNNVVPKWSDGKTELFVEEKVGYWHALAQLKKKLIRSELLFQNEKED